ncbi:flagellar hook-associated protein FlgK [Mangrovimicrobium sediminis]|uniref:Flagellar hook-associated protein 1 n=1 Tax=Mangrovimicrobium sediminis TaxID=2562682 RepID=A0A4Z0M0S4_9GAMM|nr:flagellar hook-associated protein FlgK [Haliea sp. SAOS-164]TGD73141.1 flagellar hook-associated protein FlgK [Haliea sp. SAOS-164]
MSIFSIGVSGITAAQTALNTTSNNISNVYTPGYNRELTLLQDSSVTAGVQVNAIQRQFNYFTAGQLNEATTGLRYYETYEVQVNQIDNLLADQDAGLSALMQNFFSSLSDLSAAPADPAARQGVIGAANTLTAQFRSVTDYLADMHRGINTQIDLEVDQVNNITEQIAHLNKEISITRAKTQAEPNSLLNRRDQLVAELSESLDVRVIIQGGGSYSVTLGNGQPLVSGNDSYQLRSIDSSAEPGRRVIGYVDAAGNTLEISDSKIKGGKIGGLLSFRSESLDPVRDEIGRLAVSLATEFNAIHTGGIDLNGDPGLEFFSIGGPTTFSNDKNLGTAAFSAVYGDTQDLTGVNYTLQVSNAATGEFTVTRSDGQGSFTATLDGANQITVDGVVLTLDNPALLVNGDKFNLQPTRNATADFGAVIQDISLIAAGQVGGTGDNLNAIALQDLQNTSIVGGSATLGQGYASIVSDAGNRTNIVQINRSAQEGITQQVRNLQQSESGVNLDEEAANLVRYQQYYQANAKVIEVGSTVIDTLLGLRA